MHRINKASFTLIVLTPVFMLLYTLAEYMSMQNFIQIPFTDLLISLILIFILTFDIESNKEKGTIKEVRTERGSYCDRIY